MSDHRDPSLTSLRKTLAGAPNAKLAEVVHYLDGLPSRAAAEAVLEPLRPRLREARLRRRLSLGRLVVMPFEVLIAESRRWKPGATSVPRSALRPMLATVTAALGERRAGYDFALARLDPGDDAALVAIGCQVWPGAAEVLAEAAIPSELEGLRPHDYARAVNMARAVLSQASLVEAEVLRASLGAMPDATVLANALRGAAAIGPEGFAAELSVLLARLPAVEGLLSVADEVAAKNPSLRTAAHDALAGLLDRAVAAPPPMESLARVATETERVAALLDQLGHQPGRSATLTTQIAEAKRAALETSRVSLEHGATVTLPRLADDATDQGGGVDELERAARDLKRLATVTKRLGPRGAPDQMLRDAAQETLKRAQPLSAADRARLMELLCGAEEALALFERESRG